MSGWIGVDLDGTLAEYPGTYGVPHGIGKPVPRMVSRVKAWLREGREVRIVTARAAGPFVDITGKDIGYDAAVKGVQDWCLEHIGQVLPVTCQKDYSMIELWDDRAVQVVPNKGESIDEKYLIEIESLKLYIAELEKTVNNLKTRFEMKVMYG